jgi:cytidylate kinase
MKKIALSLAISSMMLMANDTTITATMSLMNQGLTEVQSGFMYNNKENVMKGIKIMESANSIFKHVDVRTFIPNNNKVQVTKNINNNLEKNLEILKQDVKKRRYSDATKSYANVMNNCLACHTVIRGW